MPVDDVRYLIDNSVQDSAMVFIDSSTRDRRFFKTPSEYVINFEEPLKNVFGMDVLDATIPSTMFNVDTHNNRTTVYTIDNARSTLVTDNVRASTEATEQAQSEAVSAEMFALGFNADFVRWAADAYSHDIIVLDSAVFDRHLPQATQVGHSADVPDAGGVYHAVMVRNVVRNIPLGSPSGPDAESMQGAFQFMDKTYVVPATEPGERGADANVELLKWIRTSGTPYALLPCSSSRGASAFAGADEGTPMYDLVYYHALPTTAAQYQAYVDSQGVVPIWFKIAFRDAVFEPGNYTVSTLLLEIQTQMRPLGMDVVSTSSGTVEKQGKLRFVAPGDFRFIVDVTASTTGDLLGFDMYADVDMNAQPPGKRPYNAVVFGRDPRPLFMSVLRTMEGAPLPQQVLDAPGLANLLGIRYLKLRCPEIEQHVCSTGKYGRQSTGIGIFKLSGANEVSQLRFDFVNLIRKPFHPIGRMTRMTLRFETVFGTLYDFKGMNHQLLVTIKYYQPQKPVPHVRSTLNPDYDPDFLAYLNRQNRDAARALDHAGYPDESDASSDEGDDDDDAGGAGDGTDMATFGDAARRRVVLEMYKNDFLSQRADHQA